MRRLMALLATAVLACAQNPYSILPKNYSLEFENDYVRISRVKYFPGDKLAVHSHPSIPTVYVYLADGVRSGSVTRLPSSPSNVRR
jgi:hypothetical protein